MSIKMTDLAWSHAPYKSEKLLALLALADWANDDGFCRPSLNQLAKKSRVTKSTAIKILRKFQKDGAIIMVSKGGGRGNNSVYKLLPQNWQKKPAKKGIAELPFNSEKGLSAAPFTGQKKGTPATPINSEKGQPALPFNAEKGASEAGTCKEHDTHECVCDISKEIVHTQEPRGGKKSTGKKTLSVHSFETILAYTEIQKVQGAKIDPVAVAMARERDGKLDSVIDLHLAKQAEKAAAPVADMPGQLVPELLERFKNTLRRTMNAQSFDTWFAPISEMSQTDTVLFFRVPSDVFRNWIINNYSDHLDEVFEEMGLSGFHVEFLI